MKILLGGGGTIATSCSAELYPDLTRTHSHSFSCTSHLQPARQNRPQRANAGQKPGGGAAKSRFAGDVGGRLPPVTQRESQFFERVKNRLKTREVYQDFLKCLNLFAQEIISKDEMVQLVDDLLSKTPDLRKEFMDLMVKISEPSSLFNINDLVSGIVAL